jgi:hypothetical protein
MRTSHLVLGVTAAVLLIGGGATYALMSPTTWEREATAAIKGGDYEDAVKIAKRGLVEKPGNRRLQGIFLAAETLGAGKEAAFSIDAPERCMAYFNTVDVLSKNNAIWVNGAERGKAVEEAQKKLRDARQGLASEGLTIESLADLKPIAETGAKFLLSLGLDTEKKEVQLASLSAGKVLLLLDDKDGAKELIRACERGTGISSDERTRALGLLGVKYPAALKKIAFDSTHVLYGEARMALATVLWNIPEFMEKLPTYEPARITPNVSDTFRNDIANLSSAPNWRALLSSSDGIAAFKVWPFATTGWLSESGKALGSADFGWSVPYLQAGGRRGIGAVAMIRKTKVEVVPLAALLPVEDPLKDSAFAGLGTPKFKMDGSEQTIAVWIASRTETVTQFRDETHYNAYLGSSTVKVPYETRGDMNYWVVLTYNPGTKRMDRAGYRKGDDPFAPGIETLAAIPSASQPSAPPPTNP